MMILLWTTIKSFAQNVMEPDAAGKDGIVFTVTDMDSWTSNRKAQIERAEAMRREALDYQIQHAGRDDSENAFFGELDCLVELNILKQAEESQ